MDRGKEAKYTDRHLNKEEYGKSSWKKITIFSITCSNICASY